MTQFSLQEVASLMPHFLWAQIFWTFCPASSGAWLQGKSTPHVHYLPSFLRHLACFTQAWNLSLPMSGLISHPLESPADTQREALMWLKGISNCRCTGIQPSWWVGMSPAEVS